MASELVIVRVCRDDELRCVALGPQRDQLGTVPGRNVAWGLLAPIRQFSRNRPCGFLYELSPCLINCWHLIFQKCSPK